MTKKKNRFLKLMKKLHKWPAILIAVFAILFAVSGIVMNHRQFFSSVDVSRKLMPDNYEYNNWNMSSVRGSVKKDENSILIYGDIGIWETDNNFSSFSDFNDGFPKGTDNRKVYSMININGKLYAGTYFGLFEYKTDSHRWKKIALSVENERITDLSEKDDTLLVLTRDYLLKGTGNNTFETIQLPAPVNYQRSASLFKTFWELHSGELFGLPGKLLVDLLGLITIFLAVTGLIHFFLPKFIKKRKSVKKEVNKLVSTKKKNLHWHKVAGYLFAILLIINTFSGMHLRPPLLIPIASSNVGIIPATHLDTPNPWQDKLRRIEWNKDLQKYLISTLNGFYLAGENLQLPLTPTKTQPDVSVMGCNILKPLGKNRYLVGSFTGMYIWDLNTGTVYDFFTNNEHYAPNDISRPISTNMVTGMVESDNLAYWFDYNNGATLFAKSDNTPATDFPPMPENIINNSPMSIWNVALEFHTGRIFQKYIGPFYILYVPLSGICILLVLTSGFLMWWKLNKKKKEKNKKKKKATASI